MAHQVETILARIVTVLKAANTDAFTRVYRGRTVPSEEIEGSISHTLTILQILKICIFVGFVGLYGVCMHFS